MGINICIIHKDTHEDHPDWDYIRQWYDRDFPNAIDDLECTDGFEYDGYDSTFRVDSEKLRTRINSMKWEDEAKQRYYKMCDILRDNKDYFIYYCI